MSVSEPANAALAKAINQVMKAVPYVQKGGENTFHHYRYASEADFLAALQPAMVEAGLALVPNRVKSTREPAAPTQKGKAQWLTHVEVEYLLIHSSGAQITIAALGCGIDGEDKGTYKAMTGALKYALRQLFLIPTGDDAEQPNDHERGPFREEGRQPGDDQPTKEEVEWQEQVDAACALLRRRCKNIDNIRELLGYLVRESKTFRGKVPPDLTPKEMGEVVANLTAMTDEVLAKAVQNFVLTQSQNSQSGRR